MVRPWVVIALKVIAAALVVLLLVLIGLYFKGLETRVTTLESTPIVIEREIVVTPTASPSATPSPTQALRRIVSPTEADK